MKNIEFLTDILIIMGRATTPQSCYSIRQKINKTMKGIDTQKVIDALGRLVNEGYIEIIGNDYDCGHLYGLIQSPKLLETEQ